jgi:hypothetical protein
MNIRAKLLVIAGIIAAATAIWHWLCIFGGLSWYAFAHAPPIVLESVKQATLLAPAGAFIIGLLFLSCTVFAFSAAGLIRKIPLLKSALASIALLCLVRGGIGIAHLVLAQHLDRWELVASPVWFFCGVCFLLGFVEQYKMTRLGSSAQA